MKKKIIGLVLMLAILTVSNVAADNWIIDGDTVRTDSETWGELSVKPHTINGPGYVYCNATMAEDYGNIDFVWGFNTSLERPRSIDLYNPHWDNTSSTRFFQNVSNIVVCEESCEIGHEYNDIKRNVTYDRCSEWNGTTMECETYEQVTHTVCFDSYEQDGDNYTITWHNARMKYWTDKTHLIESVNYNWQGMNKWYYIKDVPMPADVTKTVRIWIDMPVSFGSGEDTKFFFAAKRTTDTIPEAIAADRFMALDPWHNASRSHRKTVNVTHVNATGSNLLNYTVFLNVSKETEMQTDFDDILFYETDGTVMSFEYENHTTDYGLFWVLVPLLIATSDTQFWMYYGNDAAASSSNPESSWNVNCSMVQHLQEAPANDTAGHLDSTSNDNDGTPKNFDGTPTSTTDGTGIIDGADVFDGTDDYVDCGNDASLNITDAITIEAWVKFPSGYGFPNSNKWIMKKTNSVLYGYGFNIYGTRLRFQGGNGSSNFLSFLSPSFSPSTDVWYYVTVTWNGTSISFYKNGACFSSTGDKTGTIVHNEKYLAIGRYSLQSSEFFNGTIDQVRVYNRALSTDEINQSYQLVENQTTFVTWGSAEQQSEDTILHIGNSVNIKDDWGRDFNSNLSANVTVANASGVWMNFSNGEFTNIFLGWVNLTLNEWVNETHNVNSPVTNISIDVTLNSTTSGATNDTESFYYEITNRTNTATMDSSATQNVETSETFHINGTCNEEYSDTFLGAANLLEDGAIIDTDNSVTDYVNFSHSEAVAGVYNYTVRFYNLTHYNNVTTPTYSNVTVTEPTYMPPDPINLQNTTGNFWVNYTWSPGTPGNVTDLYNVSWNDTWYNDTSVTYMNDTIPAGGWANITVYAFNSSGVGTLSSGSVSDEVKVSDAPPEDYIPPDPIGLANSTGNFWVNHTWNVGSGNVTNSYNVSIDTIWHNTTTVTYHNNTGLSAHDWSNVTIWAYNTSGSGSLSNGNISDNVRIPNNLITLTVTQTYNKLETETVFISDTSSSDTDSDTPIYSCNRTDLFADFSTSTGYGNWTTTITDSSTYYIDIGVSDGWSSTDNKTLTIIIYDATPGTPNGLANSTGNFWVNHTWSMGVNTDLFNISVNSSWTNDTSNEYYNNTDMIAHNWSNITVYGFNSTSSELSGSTSQNTQIPNNIPMLTGLPDNTTDEDVNQTDIFDLDNYFSDADSDTPTFLVESNNQSGNIAVTINASNNVSYTLASGWNGTAEVVINVTDGWDGEDNDTFLIFVNASPPPGDYIPSDPTNLANTTGNGWVNYTWDAGTPGNITNSYNVSWNSTWYNDTVNNYMNDSVGEFEWANITIWAYNSSGNGSLSAGNVSDDTQAGGGTFVTNMNMGVWNLISYYNSTNGTAEEFGIDIGSVDYVSKYNGSFYTHTMGMSINNFTTVHGMSYYVFLNASGSATYTRNTIPDIPYNTPIYNRWNTIGWTNATSTNAAGLITSINSTDCKYICKLNADGITNTVYSKGFVTNNYAINRGYGYWAWNSNDTSWSRNS